jgi:hypothetical protein
MRPINTQNPQYLSFSNQASKQMSILGDNAKYALYLTDQTVSRGSNNTASIPSMMPPSYDLSVPSNTIYKESFNPTLVPNTGNLNQVKENHGEILQLRSQLDQKLQELYTLNSSLTVENKVAYDTTIYTGMIWTILATSLLYVVFVKI